MSLIVGVIMYVLFSYAFAALLPLVCEGIGALVRFLALAVKVTVESLLRLAALILDLLFRGVWLAGRGSWLGAVFLYFLICEVLRGEGADEQEAAWDDDAEAADADLVEAAMTLLGLAPGFTRAELEAAFKAAIKRAHPDAGGSITQAQAVNAARALLIPLAA